MLRSAPASPEAACDLGRRQQDWLRGGAFRGCHLKLRRRTAGHLPFLFPVPFLALVLSHFGGGTSLKQCLSEQVRGGQASFYC